MLELENKSFGDNSGGGLLIVNYTFGDNSIRHFFQVALSCRHIFYPLVGLPH